MVNEVLQLRRDFAACHFWPLPSACDSLPAKTVAG